MASELRRAGACLFALLTFGSGCGGNGSSPRDFPTQSRIENVIVIVQENKSFDAYFGRWCQAAPGSNPTCESGPGCCEAAPAMDPNGVSPTVLDDTLTRSFDPNHYRDCMIDEIHGGLMDHYTMGASAIMCSDVRNFALATTAVAPYWQLAETYALADRYFQPAAGASSENDMYFAAARFKFADNTYRPDFVGGTCSFNFDTIRYDEPSITSLLEARGIPWRVYAEGIDTMRAAEATGFCPDAPSDCPAGGHIYPCVFDPSDIPFAYYATGTDDREHFTDLAQLERDLDRGRLPAFSYVKFLGYKSEHAGFGSNVTDGVAAVQALVQRILGSQYADRTLVLVTWDESGGYFDHVAPPPTSAVDGQPYGARVPLLAVGPFARKGHISHVELEHSSIVRFLEWNYLGGETGQLGARDAVVHNLGSLIDPDAAGIAVPE